VSRHLTVRLVCAIVFASDLAAGLSPLTPGSAYSTLITLQRKRYLFVCINRRADDNPKGCCAAKDSEEVYKALKEEVAARGLAKLEARVCTSSCLDQCETGVTVSGEQAGTRASFKCAGAHESISTESWQLWTYCACWMIPCFAAQSQSAVNSAGGCLSVRPKCGRCSFSIFPNVIPSAPARFGSAPRSSRASASA